MHDVIVLVFVLRWLQPERMVVRVPPKFVLPVRVLQAGATHPDGLGGSFFGASKLSIQDIAEHRASKEDQCPAAA